MSAVDPNAAARSDSGLFGLDDSLESARVVVVPVPFDATTSYHHGAARAPAAVLRASRQIDLYDVETGRPYRAGIHMLPEPPSVRAWNATAHAAATAFDSDDISEAEIAEAHERINDASRAVEHYVESRTRELLAAGKLVCVLGGDHSVPLGTIKAHVARHPDLGILHFDAHADLRRAYQGFVQSHASIMYNVMHDLPDLTRLVQVGVRDLCDEEASRIEESNGRIVTVFDAELEREKQNGVPFTRLCERIVEKLPSRVYVSFDIDGLDPALCPHTGTPVPGGLSFAEATGVLRAVVDSGRHIVGCDLTEVSPPAPSPNGEAEDDWDANVGARILYKMIGFMLKSQPG
jgi:agmatinase